MNNFRALCIAIVSMLVVAAVVFGQEKQKPTHEVIRITTELVQTGVVVIDKQGRFVDGLKREDFILEVDGQPVTPSFFEHVIFSTASQMTFLTIIYNAVPGADGRTSQLESQIEILRREQRIIASPVRPITIEPNTDIARIPYGGGVALKSLTPGRYVLRVTVKDRNANVSTANQILFDVE